MVTFNQEYSTMRIFLKPHNGFFTSHDAVKKQAEILKVIHLEVFQTLGLPAESGPNVEDLTDMQLQCVKTALSKTLVKLSGCDSLLSMTFVYTPKSDRAIIHGITLNKISQTSVKEL